LSYSFHVNNFIKVKIIEEKNRIIEESDHSKNEILGVVAHDLRSPIANIRSLLELMQHENSTEEEKLIYFNHINTCCNKAELIIRDIIIAAQEENSDSLAKLEPVNINTLLSETQRNFERILNTKQSIKLVLPNTELVININRDKVQRVLDNLMSNALKFTDKTTGVITIELEVFDNAVKICIKDNGIGIPQSQLPHLFDKFTSSGRIGLNAEPSVGLGLHISKQIIEKHGGRISVTSEESKGSIFCITLPKDTR
jgi:two-component system, OmpR family, sensor histidine kinase VicK